VPSHTYVNAAIDIPGDLEVVRGGGEKTRKTIVAIIVTCVFVSTAMLSVPSARADKPLECAMEADLVMEPLGWVGTITGDITGSMTIVENPATFPGATEHFDESFTITTTDGTVMKGYDLGVFNLKMFKFVANGAITEVSSPDWQWLVGYELHFWGSADLSVDPWHVSGSIRLTAP
jgi:hypothetical protein